METPVTNEDKDGEEVIRDPTEESGIEMKDSELRIEENFEKA